MNRPSTRGLRILAAAGIIAGLSTAGLGSASAGTTTVSKSSAAASSLSTTLSTSITASRSVVLGGLGTYTGTLQLMGPQPPGLYALQAMPLAVTVGWYDRSDDEDSFILSKRDSSGAWQPIYQVATRNRAGGGNYSFVDTDRSISGQCYMIAAVNGIGTNSTQEECTVRPDPSRFPQATEPTTQQWSGLSNVNDGTGNLQNTSRSSYTSLLSSEETFGVNLGWSEQPALWRIEAQGGPQLMRGQAVALRVWGGGWLKYGNQTWGVDLQLSDTPSYEWYVLGGSPGISISSGPWALWNSAADDYLVAGDQTWGVGLNWFKQTLPPPPPPPPPPPVGVKTYIASNCISERRPLEMWVADLTAGTGYVDKGRLDSQWLGSDCPYTGQPFVFTPTPGHQFLVRSVDFTAAGCTNDPTLASCWRSQVTFVGDANGGVFPDTLS